MSKSVEQVAANLAGALVSGLQQDAESALADFDALGLEEQAENGPIKAPLSEEDITAADDDAEAENAVAGESGSGDGSEV